MLSGRRRNERFHSNTPPQTPDQPPTRSRRLTLSFLFCDLRRLLLTLLLLQGLLLNQQVLRLRRRRLLHAPLKGDELVDELVKLPWAAEETQKKLRVSDADRGCAPTRLAPEWRT